MFNREKIRTQVLAVRDTGRTNMLDTNAVQVIANELQFYELVVFIEECRSEYVHLIFTGEFKEEKEPSGSERVKEMESLFGCIPDDISLEEAKEE